MTSDYIPDVVRIKKQHYVRSNNRRYSGKLECRQGRDISAAVEYSGYDININKVDVENRFDETCQGTVPVAFWIIRQSTSFEDAIRRAVSLGADADTLGAIVGSIAEARWGIPDDIRQKTMEYLPEEMKHVIANFITNSM